MNDEVNEEWLSDKARFICDGLKRQRLLQPMLKNEFGVLSPCNWEEALFSAAQKLRQVHSDAIAGLAGALVDSESLIALKDLLNLTNTENVFSEGELPISSGGIDLRSNYLFNDKIANVEKCDVLLLVGTNPRYEAPVFNARIRKTYLYSDIEIGVIGANVDLTYDYTYLGSNSSVLDDLLSGKSTFSKKLENANYPMIVVGTQAIQGGGSEAINQKLQQLTEKLRSFSSAKQKPEVNGQAKVLNWLHEFAGHVAAFDIGYRPFNELSPEVKKSIKLLYLLGADDKPISRKDFHQDVFVIYQGHHGDNGAELADLILPGAAYTEKEAIWVNTEGRAQRGYPAIVPPGDARVDWKIIRALSEVAGHKLPYDSIMDIRHRLSEVAPHLNRYGMAEETNYSRQASLLSQEASVSPVSRSLEPRQCTLADYWLTNSIARASPTMAQCVKASRPRDKKRASHHLVELGYEIVNSSIEKHTIYVHFEMVMLTVLRKARRKEQEMRVLILGLDNSGKTTFLKKISGENISDTAPTFGFNIKTLEFKDAVIWVVDACDKGRLDDCCRELHSLINEECLHGVTLLVLANKHDLVGSMHGQEIEKILHLERIKHHWRIYETSAYTGDGLLDSLGWLIQDVNSRILVPD
uniref:NADH-ubiquinone oxidoreductase 75 kDa subunit, mitochondrial n=1 Tax=Globodera rostochiensis TaxID=31243 RepID=A0A914GVI0_GLORO